MSSQTLLGSQDDRKRSIDHHAEEELSSYEECITAHRLQHQSRISLFKQWISWVVKGVILLLAIYGLFELGAILRHPPPLLSSEVQPDNTICDCGNSTTEAVAMGCTYVPLSAAWLPPHCRDEELEWEFDHAGPGPNGTWKYYADMNVTTTSDVADLGALADVPGDVVLYYNSMRWHIVHCVFYWKKLHRMQGKMGRFMEPRYGAMRHIEHCGKVFLNRMDREKIVTSQGSSLTSGID